MKNIPYLTIAAGMLLLIFLVNVPAYRSAGDYLLAGAALAALALAGVLEIRRKRERAEFKARLFGAVDSKIGHGCAPRAGFVPPKPTPRKISYGRAKKI